MVPSFLMSIVAVLESPGILVVRLNAASHAPFELVSTPPLDDRHAVALSTLLVSTSAPVENVELLVVDAVNDAYVPTAPPPTSVIAMRTQSHFGTLRCCLGGCT